MIHFNPQLEQYVSRIPIWKQSHRKVPPRLAETAWALLYV
jgi:hypothetical protein